MSSSINKDFFRKYNAEIPTSAVKICTEMTRSKFIENVVSKPDCSWEKKKFIYFLWLKNCFFFCFFVFFLRYLSNSPPSQIWHGHFIVGAMHESKLICSCHKKTLDLVSILHFGMPQPPNDKLSPAKQVFPRGKSSWEQGISIITPTWREHQMDSGKL